MKLKPCPFCGKQPEISHYHGMYRIDCCIVKTSSRFKKDVVDIWNDRYELGEDSEDIENDLTEWLQTRSDHLKGIVHKSTGRNPDAYNHRVVNFAKGRIAAYESVILWLTLNKTL